MCRWFSVIVVVVLSALGAIGEEFSGRVVAIADGDTITVLVGKQQHKVRLHGIDCPEVKQPFSQKAKEFTGDLAFGKKVTVESHGKDRYGRDLGRVTLPNGKILNEEILTAGLAWWYWKFAPKETGFEKLEQEARKAKRGLWADKNPVPPWEFRANPKPAKKPPPPKAAASK